MSSIHTRYNPTIVDGCALWLSGNQSWKKSVELRASTFAEDWTDRSGFGNNAVQASEILQPTFNPTGLNGKGTLSFVNGPLLSIPDSPELNVQAHTIFIVSKTNDLTPSFPRVFGKGSGVERNYGYFYQGGGSGLGLYQCWSAGPNLELYTTSSLGTTWHVQCMVYDLSKADLYVDSVLNASTSYSETLYNTAVPAVIGSSNSNIEVAEIILYNRALTGSQILTMNNYLSGEWNL